MQTLLQDLRYGARILLKNPGFTLIAVFTLALGIGANTAIFGLMDKLMVRSLPVKEPSRLVLLQSECLNPRLTFSDFSWADYNDYRAQNRVFTELTAFAQQPVNLGSGDQMERVRAEAVADNYFGMLGVQLLLGRAFLPEENKTPGANVANLLLARAASRRKEIAVRLALGAGRARLARQLLTESLSLALLGGCVGTLFAPWLTDLLLAYQKITDTEVEVLSHSMNLRVIAFTFLVSSLTGLLFGLVPALQASKPDLIPSLKDEGALRPDGAGFLLRSLGKLFAISPGYNPDNVLVAKLELPMSKYDGARSEAFYRQLLERLRALPEVQRVAMATSTPLGGSVGLSTFTIKGQPVKPEEMTTT